MLDTLAEIKRCCVHIACNSENPRYYSYEKDLALAEHGSFDVCVRAGSEFVIYTNSSNTFYEVTSYGKKDLYRVINPK